MNRAASGKWWVPVSLRGYQRSWLGPDIIAGVTLAAIAIPACIGYTKIAGTPVVTGLYTILLPIAAFALLGSSRHLVVGADSATAAILFAGLTGMAQPGSDRWLVLSSSAALLTGGLLFFASLLRLGFLADFLSRTVLVGFLGGVGLSLVIGELPDMLGITVKASDFIGRTLGVSRNLSHAHAPTLIMAFVVLGVILLCERLSEKAPGPLLAIALAIAATWVFGLDRHGIEIVGHVTSGLPRIRIPDVPARDVARLLPTVLSMFLVVIAQSAATSRSFAHKYGEVLDENREFMALGAANVLAGVSSTFVVNGSPSKTAVVDSAGGRTQVSQLTTGGVVLVVLLFATSLIERIPNAALAALVFVIGIRLIDLRSLLQIYHFRKRTFVVALGAMLLVLFLGVERGILCAVALSILDHLQQEYRPKDVILMHDSGHWKAVGASAGLETAPGLLIYRFQAPLFFANVDRFNAHLQELVDGAPHAVEWLVIDLVSMNDIDYTAALTLLSTVRRLRQRNITIAFAQAEDVHVQLDRFGITDQVGADHLFESVHDALDAFERRMGDAPDGPRAPIAPAVV